MNKEELVYGAVFGLFLGIFIGWWCIITSFLCGYLWARSGMNGESKAWRRIWVPFIGCLSAWIAVDSWYAWLPMPIAYGLLSFGYGIPSTHPPDEGSAIGRFWFRFLNKNESLAEIATRITILSPLYAVYFGVLWRAS